MIKWFAYIGLLLIFAPFFLSAKIKKQHFHVYTYNLGLGRALPGFSGDTTKSSKKQEQSDAKKIKEVARTKKQPKPEKIETKDNAAASKPKPKRQRRPEGLERPPEIPRRNGN
jgi:hypothetical protein